MTTIVGLLTFKPSKDNRLRGYKTFLCSTEHEISTAHGKFGGKYFFFALKLLDAVFFLLIKVKMPTIIGILTFMSRINFMLS